MCKASRLFRISWIRFIASTEKKNEKWKEKRINFDLKKWNLAKKFYRSHPIARGCISVEYCAAFQILMLDPEWALFLLTFWILSSTQFFWGFAFVWMPCGIYCGKNEKSVIFFVIFNQSINQLYLYYSQIVHTRHETTKAPK